MDDQWTHTLTTRKNGGAGAKEWEKIDYEIYMVGEHLLKILFPTQTLSTYSYTYTRHENRNKALQRIQYIQSGI